MDGLRLVCEPQGWRPRAPSGGYGDLDGGGTTRGGNGRRSGAVDCGDFVLQFASDLALGHPHWGLFGCEAVLMGRLPVYLDWFRRHERAALSFCADFDGSFRNLGAVLT